MSERREMTTAERVAAWRAPKVLWGRTFPLSLDGHAQIVEALHGSRHTRRLRAQRAAGRRGREGGRA